MMNSLVRKISIVRVYMKEVFFLESVAACLFSLFDECELNVSYAVGSNPSKELNAGSTICIESMAFPTSRI